MSQILAGNDWVTLGDEYDLLNAACDVGDGDDVTATSDDLLKHNTHITQISVLWKFAKFQNYNVVIFCWNCTVKYQPFLASNHISEFIGGKLD